MAEANGQLTASVLQPVGQGLFLEREAAESFLAMRAHVLGKTGHTMTLNAAYRTLAKQQFLYNGFIHHLAGFNLAAVPGTSNHGWGLAIDVHAPLDRTYLDRFGSPFGWAKQWSDAPSEFWHIRFNAEVWRRNRSQLIDPLAPLMDDEREWLRSYLQLHKSGTDVAERRRLWHRLRARRRDIWRSAQRGGWDERRRRDRYGIIRHYIGG
jgi:D-alanyl-D-alanine carboxypeptidase-like protein